MQHDIMVPKKRGERVHRHQSGGFSLVELIIVIAIMAALVGILAPQYIKYIARSREAACQANLAQAAQAYDIERVDQGDRTSKEMINTVLTQMGGKTVTASRYTGLCPAGGETMILFAVDGSVKLTCSKHLANSAPDFAGALVSWVVSGDLNRKLADGKTQTLLDFFKKSSSVVIDSEATSAGTSKVPSFTSVLRDKLGSSIADDQSWRLSYDKANDQYVIYITTGGKITAAEKGQSVDVVKYVYTSSGTVVSQSSTTATVTYLDKFKYPQLTPKS